jgi:protein-disulfide isomerase
MRRMLFGIVAALALAAGCQRKTETMASPAPSSSAAGGVTECEAYVTAVCGKAGQDSSHCHSMRDLQNVLPAQACVAGLSNMVFTEQKIAIEMKPCTDIANRLCKDIGPDTESCKMVRLRTPGFASAQCVAMDKDYASVLGELQKNEDKLKPLSPEKQALIVANTNTYFGPPASKVKLVEFSDFQCPFCAGATKTVDEVRKKYGDKVYFVFRQFPLDFHDNAHLAAEAALAAAAQGKFWEFHDKVFANQSNIKRADLETYAKEVGLDVAKFKKALDTGEYKVAVDNDLALGRTVNVEGTPTLFLNGKVVPNVSDTPALLAAIDAQLK